MGFPELVWDPLSQRRPGRWISFCETSATLFWDACIRAGPPSFSFSVVRSSACSRWYHAVGFWSVLSQTPGL